MNDNRDQFVIAKARMLQERRATTPGVGYYWRTQYQRQLIFLALYAVVITALFVTNWPVIAAIFLGFAVGRTVRDLQWYRALGQEWETTAEFVDWKKVAEMANERNP